MFDVEQTISCSVLARFTSWPRLRSTLFSLSCAVVGWSQGFHPTDKEQFTSMVVIFFCVTAGEQRSVGGDDAVACCHHRCDKDSISRLGGEKLQLMTLFG